MAPAKKSASKTDKRLTSSKENLLIEKEKRYQRKVKGPQVEQQTQLKETKKKAKPVKSRK